MRGKNAGAGAVNAGAEPNDDMPLEEIEGEWEVLFHKDGCRRVTARVS
jgi:hypothetical protein